MKITVLTYLDSEDENSKDYEAVVPQVAKALRSLGHRVSILGVHGRRQAAHRRPLPPQARSRLQSHGDVRRQRLRRHSSGRTARSARAQYTGSGPGELYLSQDKGLTKKLLAFEDILYPRLRGLLPAGRRSRPAATSGCRFS